MIKTFDDFRLNESVLTEKLHGVSDSQEKTIKEYAYKVLPDYFMKIVQQYLDSGALSESDLSSDKIVPILYRASLEKAARAWPVDKEKAYKNLTKF